MRTLLYYPGFEVQDQTWLKFALLYFDCLRPIIPQTIIHEREYLGETFRRVMDETDLIDPYRPKYDEGIQASALACEEFEKYFKHPERYGSFFGSGYTDRLLEKWQNPKALNYTLFEGKYTKVFFDFCINNRIATPCTEGIQISEDLSFVYMSFLADIISQNNDLEMITDSNRYSSILLRRNARNAGLLKDKLKTVRNDIEFSIPANLSDIPIETIIQLRKQKRFNDLRKAYMVEIEKLIDSRENQNVNFSLDHLLSYEKDMVKLCEKSFNMIAAATISVISLKALLNGIQGAELFPALATAYMDYSTAKEAITEIPQIVERIKTKHLARKYVAKIGKLNTDYRLR